MSFTAFVLSPKLVLNNNTDMKMVNIVPISSLGGLNFVLDEFQGIGLGRYTVFQL